MWRHVPSVLLLCYSPEFVHTLCLICGSAKKKSYYFGEFALLVRFMNRTTSVIVLSEFVLSGDPCISLVFRQKFIKNSQIRLVICNLTLKTLLVFSLLFAWSCHCHFKGHHHFFCKSFWSDQRKNEKSAFSRSTLIFYDLNFARVLKGQLIL